MSFSQSPPHKFFPITLPMVSAALTCMGVGGVGEGVSSQREAGIESHLYFLPKDEPEERNRRPGGSFPLVNKLFAEHHMSCGAVILTVSYAPAPRHFRRFPPR